MVAECNDAPMCDEEYGVSYYFDRSRLIWKFAKIEEHTGREIAISEKPALRLLLDGEKSRFE